MAKTLKDMTTMLQAAADGGEDVVKLKDLAFQLGDIAWMSCTSANELAPVADVMKGDLRKAFLQGLSRVINAPNNDDSMIARNLQPYVFEQLRLTA